MFTLLISGCALREEYQAEATPEVVPAPALPPAPAAAPLPQMGKLSLQQCVDFAIERNFSVRQSLAMARAQRALEEVQRADFDPQLFGNTRTGRTAGGDWDGVDVSAGVLQKFDTGTEMELEAGQVATRTGDFRDDYIGGSSSDFAATVRQPLLRGGGRTVNRAGIRIAELLTVQASATVTAEVLETLRTVETAYYAAAVAAMVERSQLESYTRARKLADDIAARRKAGAASKIDEMEAAAALSLARERLVNAMKASGDRIGDLWLALGAPLDSKLPEVRLSPLSDQSLPEEAPDSASAFARAMSAAPSAILLVNEVQRREIELLRAKNRALPRLDAEISAASASDSEGSDDWEGVALLRFNIPWGLRAEKAQFAAAKAELDRSVAARDEATERLKQRIYELCRAIHAGRAQVDAAAQTARVSRQKYDEQIAQLKAGLVTVRDLRESEEELQASEVREQQARLSLFAGWSALTQLDGSIAQRYGLSL